MVNTLAKMVDWCNLVIHHDFHGLKLPYLFFYFKDHYIEIRLCKEKAGGVQITRPLILDTLPHCYHE